MKFHAMLILFVAVAFVVCKIPKNGKQVVENIDSTDNQETVTKVRGNFLGSEIKGNYIWGSAMNYAWHELKDTIIKEPIKLESKDPLAQKIVSTFNASPFTKKDMDVASYYVKCGFGQETVDQINREVKKKFPQMTLGGVNVRLNPKDIISFAYFLKKVKYRRVFDSANVDFLGQPVRGFVAGTPQQRENVCVVKYWNDDNFIISLQLKDDNDELLLAKGFDMTSPQSALDSIVAFSNDYHPVIEPLEAFEMVNLHAIHTHVYEELLQKKIGNDNFTHYAIGQMYEMIKFDLDEKGARVENKAVIALPTAMPPEEGKKIRSFIMDKPFWVIMKRRGNKNPYFVLGVSNTELMKKR